MTTTPPAEAEPPIHLTLDRGYSIACRPHEHRPTIQPIPAIVELCDHELITCPDCMLLAADEIEKRANNPRPALRELPAAERIAVALERIATVLEDPRSQAEMAFGVWERLSTARRGRY